ncbi:MAG: ester cyclase [Chloroflexi bacterium]|nr:MAG: ester cyclase [Chloroflexota bacterium]
MSRLRELVDRHYHGINSHNMNIAVEVFHPDVEAAMPGAPPTRGVDAHREYGDVLMSAIPDMTVAIKEVYEGPDTIIVEGTFSGTQTGTLTGPGGDIPATGRRFELDYCDVFKVRDGKVVAHRVYFDQLSLLGQLGVTPAPTGR